MGNNPKEPGAEEAPAHGGDAGSTATAHPANDVMEDDTAHHADSSGRQPGAGADTRGAKRT